MNHRSELYNHLQNPFIKNPDISIEGQKTEYTLVFFLTNDVRNLFFFSLVLSDTYIISFNVRAQLFKASLA